MSCIDIAERCVLLCMGIYIPLYNSLPFDDHKGVSAHSHTTFRLYSFLSIGVMDLVLCERITSKLHCVSEALYIKLTL